MKVWYDLGTSKVLGAPRQKATLWQKCEENPSPYTTALQNPQNCSLALTKSQLLASRKKPQ